MKFKKGMTPKNKLTQEQFITKCEDVHKGFYDYSKVVYNTMSEKITVICPKHGEFSVRAANHKRGDGCQKCYDERRGFGTRKGYDYYMKVINESSVNEIELVDGVVETKKSVITLRCKKHYVEYSGTLGNLLGRLGCEKCKAETVTKNNLDKRKKWFDDFIKDFEHIELLELNEMRDNSHFKCNKHKVNFSTPLSSAKENGYIGCRECSYERNTEKLFSTSHEKMKEKLENTESHFKYGFDKFVYNGWQGRIKLVCSKHGDFETKYLHRAKGVGYGECHQCMKDLSIKRLHEDFLEKAFELHGDLYDYSLVDYTQCKNHVDIKCNTCNTIFRQTPDNHLQGNGCSECNSISVYSKDMYAKHAKEKNGGLCNIYLIKCYNDSEEFYKVGITINNVKTRFSSKSSMPYSYQIIYEIEGDVDVVLKLETLIHREVKEFHYLPIIPFGGCYKECFNEYGLSIAEDLILQINYN